METDKKPLWTRSFIFAFISNLLMFFSFYLLVPVLPFYVLENLGASESVAGVVLSLYTLAALAIRPFAGPLVDTIARKPLYLVVYTVFTAVFAGYLVAGTLTLFIIMRVLHGFAFGINTVSGSTLALDIMPSERRGQGIGYFGMTSSIAMAMGPMVGLFIYNSYTFDVLFMVSFISSFLGLLAIFMINAPQKVLPQKAEAEMVSLDRFILVRGLPISAVYLTVSMGYGVLANYIGLYSKSVGMESQAGMFFTVEAIGIFVARLLSGRDINRGALSRLVYIGMVLVILGYLCLMVWSGAWAFYVGAAVLGLGFGYISPAIQTMFINLAEHNRRGTANSTFYTSWDVGLGVGIACGGWVIEHSSFVVLYGICAGVLLLGLWGFKRWSGPYFEKHKLR